MRKYLRQVAKNRLRALGYDRVNRNMQNWKRVMWGDLAPKAEIALRRMNDPDTFKRTDSRAGERCGSSERRQNNDIE